MSAVILERDFCITGCGRPREFWVESGELPLIVGYCETCVSRCADDECNHPVAIFSTNGGESYCRFHDTDRN